MTAKILFTNDQEKEIVRLYRNGLSTANVGKKFGISFQPIIRILKEYNIYRYSNRKYFFNEKYFENIDTEEKAYWLGFMTADGCVRVRKGGYSIHLTSIDVDHLNKFKNAIGYIGGLKCVHGRCYRLEAHSKKIVNDLCKLGVVPRKTFCTSMPDIDESLFKHFIRGVIDGDGNLGYYGDSWRLSLASGTHSFVKSIKKLINNRLSVEGGSIYKKAGCNCYVLSFGGNQLAYKVGKFLYDQAEIYLDRKYKKYLKMCAYVDNPIKELRIKIFKKCIISRCTKTLYAKNLCRFHYDQQRYYGELS